MAVLARGGNAFDAAVAAGFVLQVVEPHLNGPGGEVPAVFATAADPAPRVLCAQGVLPAAATVERLRDELGLPIVPGTGLLAATVPGAWDGWLTLLRDHGTLRLADVLEPALGYAAGGFGLVPRVPPTIDAVAELFRAHWPSSAATWLPRRPGAAPGAPAAGLGCDLDPAAGDRGRGRGEPGAPARRRPPRLVPRVRRRGDRRVLPDRVHDDDRPRPGRPAHRGRPGRLVGELRAARSPPAGDGWTVAKPGAWSQGPVLAQQLALLDGAVRYRDGVATADTVHRVTEAAKLAFADREAWYGDSARVPAGRRCSIRPTAPTPGADHRHRVAGAAARLPRRACRGCRPTPSSGGPGAHPARRGPGLGEPTVGRSGAVRGDTVHIDVVDRPAT